MSLQKYVCKAVAEILPGVKCRVRIKWNDESDKCRICIRSARQKLPSYSQWHAICDRAWQLIEEAGEAGSGQFDGKYSPRDFFRIDWRWSYVPERKEERKKEEAAD